MSYTASAEKALDFHIESYKLRIEYVTKQFDRMWNRFQLLLGIDTALVALIFTPLTQKRFSTAVFASLGFVVSLFWFLIGAEDKFLVEVYREQLRRETSQLKTLLDLPDYVGVGDTDAATAVRRDLLQFRFHRASITRLVVIVPLLLLIGFGVLVLVAAFGAI